MWHWAWNYTSDFFCSGFQLVLKALLDHLVLFPSLSRNVEVYSQLSHFFFKLPECNELPVIAGAGHGLGNLWGCYAGGNPHFADRSNIDQILFLRFV